MALQVHGSLTKTGFAYLSLRELIITGELTPGTAIQQGDLAKKMGVSTTPLREAIRRLSAEGLISLSAHKDARVTEVTADEARHLLEVRDQLDPLAAGLAAARRTEDELTRIIQASSQLQPLSEGVDLPALMAHREFHRAIYVASHNPILVDLLERLWDKADRYRLIGLQSRGDSAAESSRVAAEHRELVDAITVGDSKRAEATMRRHIQGSLGGRAIEVLEATSHT